MSEARVLTAEQARELKLPMVVYLEESGGFEKSRYKAEAVVAHETDDEAMYFLFHSGRAWSGYNRDCCGWRLWSKRPTLEEQLREPWK